MVKLTALQRFNIQAIKLSLVYSVSVSGLQPHLHSLSDPTGKADHDSYIMRNKPYS